MSQVVEDLLDKHNLLNRPKKVALIDGIPRPKFYWKRLRESIRSTIDAVTRSDNEEKTVRHGIHFLRDILHEERILCGLYNKLTQEYLTLDTNYIYVYKSDGRKSDTVVPACRMERMIHANMFNLYVAWIPGKEDLYLLNKDFDIISESAAGYDIISAIYNESNGEMITSGAGAISMWAFRYGARHLIPRATTTHNLSADDKFSMLVVEDTAHAAQKMFAVCRTSVAVFHVGDCVLVDYHHSLHSRNITAAVFFNPMKYVITGAKDGCIKVWTDQFSLQHVFIGHTGPVNKMCIYPYGSNFLSAGADRSLRLWSLDLKDQVDSKEVDEPIDGMGAVIRHDYFYTYSGDVMKLWQLSHLHCEHTTIGYRVNDVKQSSHPMFPVRSLLRCNDSSVRIISPLSGDVITSLLMPMQRDMVDMAYASENKMCNCLLVYEYIVNIWGAKTKTDEIPTSDRQHGQKRQNKTLLLGGRRDGYICVFNMEDGKVDFEIEAHGLEGVRKMVANAKFDQLISAGADNIIKIWRVYPYAHEALTPLMSFFCAHLPAHMVMLKTRLCVAFEDHGTATYNIIIHDLETKDRFDHAPVCDHADPITGLSCCQRLKVFASSSYDGTIRIWNEINELLRVLILNATPFSSSFCSQKGDILVGIGNHLHIIDHANFLPRQLLFRLVCTRFPPLRFETSLPWDEQQLAKLSTLDLGRLKAARAALRFASFADLLTEEETDELLREKRAKEKAFSLLGAREQELAMIRDGKLQAKPRRKSTRVTRGEAFDKFLKIFYDRQKLEIPDEVKSIDEQVKEIMEGPKKPVVEEYQPELTSGFFPPPETVAKPQKHEAPYKPLEPHYRFPPDGFIPNSVLTRLLWPEKQKAMLRKECRPTNLTAEQMAKISQMNQMLAQEAETLVETKKTERRMRDLDKERGVRSAEDGGEVRLSPMETAHEKSELSEQPSDFMMKMKGVMEKPAQSELEVELTEPTRMSRDTTSVTTTSAKTELAASKSREMKPLKPIKKLVSRGPPSETRLRPPPPKISSTDAEIDVGQRSRGDKDQKPAAMPLPPETLPEFILRCKGEDWFDKFFPNCCEKTMPKPWTLDAFITMVLRVLRIAEYEDKAGVCKALRTIQTIEGLPNAFLVRSTVLGILNSDQNPPSCSNGNEKRFIEAGLHLIAALQINDKTTLSTLMFMYLDGDKEIRNMVKELFTNLGLKDLHGYFYQELDRWEVWSLSDKNLRKSLMAMCEDWLEKWMTAFKKHIEDTIEKLKRGEGVQGKLGTKSSQNATHGGKKKKDLVDPLDRAVTVMFDRPPDQSTVDNATYLEAINYFVEVGRLKSSQKTKMDSSGKEEDTSGPKNTVLVLPRVQKKLSLVRLGETHASQCHPSRETTLNVDYRRMSRTSRGLPPAPGELHGFTPAIVLPMKSIDMNPFGPDYPLNEPMFVTLRLAPKYYIPECSIVSRKYSIYRT